MLPLFTEPLDQLTAGHVHTLVAENVPEGQTVEFKRTLAAKKGTTDPWVKGGDSVGERARDNVLKELVAFANSGGGNLVLGIVESDDHPKRAINLNLLPRCHELADRLRLAARDCIDPQLPALEVCGIPTGDEDAGVVLFRVPPSRLAPHRLRPTLHCYVRRADRSEEMTMHEIQDASVRLARGGEDIKRRLDESRANYMALATEARRSGSVNELGIRATVLPVGGSIFIDWVYRNEELRIVREEITTVVNDAQFIIDLPGVRDLPQLAFRPVLRGAQRVETSANRTISESIYSDGLVEFVYKHPETEHIYIGWVLAMAANALIVADTARKVAGVPGAELLLDIEMRSDRYSDRPTFSRTFSITTGRKDQIYSMRPEPLRLPLQSITGVDEFSQAIRRLLDDLRNVCGLPHVGQFDIVL